MNTLTDIQVLIVARTIGNTSTFDLRKVVNKRSVHQGGSDAGITDAAIQACDIYQLFRNELEARNIDYYTGKKDVVTTTQTVLKGIL